ncbi:MAG TPA: SDR family NAD(P)-dependent oxidoreductase [Dehalococcoidia bacterium]|nr:SDR family NAD(P)-dependent oxidoreductase [Dehalococcoidia bacterium]
MLLEGKAAVVTGAGRGIGRAIAIQMAEEGAKVVVNDAGVGPDGQGHDDGPADQVVAEIVARGLTAVANYDSVATMAGGESIIKTAVDSFGRVDVLVNNAGILRDRMIFNMSEQEWDDVIAVHLKGHFACTKPAAVIMRQQRCGRIINFSSESGLWGNAGQANYGAAKSGIAGFTRVVARDMGRYGVTCNAIAPRAWTRLTATIPEQRPGVGAPRSPELEELAPECVSPMVCYLASDHAWNINGQIFHVYAGTVALLHHPLPSRTIFKNGMWTLDELSKMVPQMLEGTRNPAPPPDELEIPGRAPGVGATFRSPAEPQTEAPAEPRAAG